MGMQKEVTFVFDGTEYRMTARHYKRNHQSFIKATWYDYDRWTGNRYERFVVLTWFFVGDKPLFYDRMKRSREFVQPLGEFLFKELQVPVTEKR
jgi:hypothetical protein